MLVFFYKEWIKTRYFFLIALVLSVLFCVYAMLNINRVIELKGAAHIWEVMLQRDAIFIHYLRFVPLLMGAVAGMMQFVPEMQQKRIKLTYQRTRRRRIVKVDHADWHVGRLPAGHQRREKDRDKDREQHYAEQVHLVLAHNAALTACHATNPFKYTPLHC